LYGKFPDLTDITAIVRRLYGDNFMDIFAETSKMITEEAGRRLRTTRSVKKLDLPIQRFRDV